MRWLIWMLGAWGVLVIMASAFLIWRNLRKRPRCPVHGCRMEYWSDMEPDKDEFNCPVEDCRWCCDVYENGYIQLFEV